VEFAVLGIGLIVVTLIHLILHAKFIQLFLRESEGLQYSIAEPIQSILSEDLEISADLMPKTSRIDLQAVL